LSVLINHGGIPYLNLPEQAVSAEFRTNNRNKPTLEWKFKPKETAAPITAPRLKIAQKILINLPF